MASSEIKAHFSKTTLYGGAVTDKAINGTISFSDNVNNYDYLLLRIMTNADFFEERMYAFYKKVNYYYTIYDASIGWLSSAFYMTISADGNSASVSGTSNNLNWIAGVFEVIGVKIN